MGNVLITAVMLVSLFLSPVAAETITEAPFKPFHPEFMAQGASYTTIARGYNSLFTNPAGFGEPRGELTVGALSFWSHSGLRQSPELIRMLFSGGADGAADQDYLDKQFSGAGYGLGGSFGLGYTSKGFGIGFLAGFDTFLSGDDYPSELSGYLLNEYMIVAGYSFSFDFSWIKLLVGADVRPLVRIHSILDNEASALMVHRYFNADIGPNPGDPFKSLFALNGSGVAIDAGLIAHSGPVSLGLVFRDIFDTQLRYSLNSLGEIRNAMKKGGLPPAQAAPGDSVYIIPMSTAVGAAFHPDMGGLSRYFRPLLHFEINDPLGAFESRDSFVERFRMGGEIKIFNNLSLRGGLLRGYPTYGAGFSFFIFDLNVAVFNAGLSRRSGSGNVPGISVEAAVRW
jgi:hypothetical protein